MRAAVVVSVWVRVLREDQKKHVRNIQACHSHIQQGTIAHQQWWCSLLTSLVAFDRIVLFVLCACVVSLRCVVLVPACLFLSSSLSYTPLILHYARTSPCPVTGVGVRDV